MRTVTVQQIARALGRTDQAVYVRAGREGWRAVGSRPKAYLLDELPADVRQAVLAVAAPASCSDNGTVQQQKQQAPFAQISAQIEAIPPKELQKASQRAALVTAYKYALDEGRRQRRNLQQIREGFVSAYNTGLIHAGIHGAIGQTSWQTLERWKRELEAAQGDCQALVTRYGQHRRGVTKVQPQEAAILQRLLLHQHQLKINTAIAYCKTELQRLGLESPSSPATLRRWVERLRAERNDLWTLMRQGQKALMDNVLPTLRRDRTSLAVGDVLIADGHVCNFRVISPYHGKPVRPVLIAWEDWRSAYIPGWSLMLTEDVNAIHLALKRAVERMGFAPAVAYLDNGRAFKARFFTEPEQVDFEDLGFGGLYARLGTQVVFARAYNPQSKPVEPFFRTMSLQFEKLLPSYIGGSIGDKPARMRRNEKFMQQLAPGRDLEWEEAQEAIQSWLDHYYHQTPHQGAGLDGQSPAQVFETGRTNRALDIDPERLRFLLLASKPTQVRRSAVELFGQYYLAEELYGLRDRVILRFDLHDLQEVHVYRMDGSYVCTAPRQEQVHPMTVLAPESADEFKRQRQRQQQLKKGTLKDAAALAAGTTDTLDALQLSTPLQDLLPEATSAKAQNKPAGNSRAARLINPTDWTDLDSDWESNETGPDMLPHARAANER